MYQSIRLNPLATLCLLMIFLLSTTVDADETIEVGYRGCTFNDAIRAANTNQPVGDCRAGDPGHDHIYIHGIVEIRESPVTITEDVAIVGDRDISTLDGRGRFSFIHVGPGVNVQLQDFSMSNGYGTRETGQLRVESGGRVHLNTTKITNCHGVKEIVAPDDATVSIGYASSVCGKMKPFIPPPGSKDAPASDRRAKPVEYTCEHLPDNIIVRPVAGTRSGIQCQVIHEAGVGQRAVIDKGIIAAVDIWAWVDPGVEVCLRGQGNLIFLDAADAPRSVSPIPAYTELDMTCATFNRPGSLVLVRSDESMLSTANQQALENCTVRTTDLLRLRDLPAGSATLVTLPIGAYYSAVARTRDWFQIAYSGSLGWVSADYVKPFENCG